MTSHFESRWLALLLLCLGELMIVLDTTIVNVALPSIRSDLGFTPESLVWVVNAYMLTFSGFLLLGGRLGDIYGRKALFLTGLVLFTGASLMCGVSQTQVALIAARALQGIGGAIVSAIALSLIMSLFVDQHERARAMGIIGFIAAGGGAIGVLLGGLLTGTFDWHWVFLINVPIGVVVFLACLRLLPRADANTESMHLDLGGAVTVTAALMIAVYAIVGGNEAGWTSLRTLSGLGIATLLMALFIYIESRVRDPLMPLSLFQLRSVVVSNIVGVLWSAAMFAWFFMSALYMQTILGYPPLHVGLAFLPSNLIMAAFSLGLSAWVVTHYGIRMPLTIAMSCIAAGLLCFAFAPADGTLWLHVMPGMILLGIGAGMGFNPVLLAAMGDVPQKDSGLASGVVNTAFMMGGSIGLAVLASLAAMKTLALQAAGATPSVALLGGYHVAFIAGASFAAAAAVVAAAFLKEVTDKEWIDAPQAGH